MRHTLIIKTELLRSIIPLPEDFSGDEVELTITPLPKQEAPGKIIKLFNDRIAKAPADKTFETEVFDEAVIPARALEEIKHSFEERGFKVKINKIGGKIMITILWENA